MGSVVLDTLFNQDYSQEIQQHLDQKEVLPPCYVAPSQKESLMGRVFSRLSSPFSALHTHFGRKLFCVEHLQKEAQYVRPTINLDSDLKYRRITLRTNEMDIDAMIVIREATKGTDRWILPALGLHGIYEQQLAHSPDYPCSEDRYRQLSKQLGANILFFNSPEMGSTTGTLTQKSLIKAHNVALQFLTDPEGLGAHEVIFYGHSTGAVVQGKSLALQQPSRKDVRQVVVADRTFSTAFPVLKRLSGTFTATLFVALGWNMTALKWYKSSTVPTIVISALKDLETTTALESITEKQYVDEVIPYSGSLLRALSKNPLIKFFGVPEQHKYPIKETQPLANAIEECFAIQKS